MAEQEGSVADFAVFFVACCHVKNRWPNCCDNKKGKTYFRARFVPIL